jgi:hypothetical protein
MTYANKLKYAGNDPYKPEAERLPYPVFEALTNGADPAAQYERLAQVRWLADELESETADDTDMIPEAQDALFRAVADIDAPLQVMVDEYVAGWLHRRAGWLVETWGIDPELVAEACEEYGVGDACAEVLADA